MEQCKRGEGLDCREFEIKVRSVLALKTIAVVGMSPQETDRVIGWKVSD